MTANPLHNPLRTTARTPALPPIFPQGQNQIPLSFRVTPPGGIPELTLALSCRPRAGPTVGSAGMGGMEALWAFPCPFTPGGRWGSRKPQGLGFAFQPPTPTPYSCVTSAND